MVTPPFWYTVAWLGLSFLYFWYWNARPQYSFFFLVVGIFLIVLSLVNGLGFLR